MDTQTPGTPGDLSGHADAPPAGSAEALSLVLQDLLQLEDAEAVEGAEEAGSSISRMARSAVITRAYEQLAAFDACLRGQVAVWISPHNSDRAQVVESLVRRDCSVLGKMDYLSIDHGDMACMGWVRVGTASMTMPTTSQAELLDSHVKALRAQQAQARADAQAQDTEFERQIQCLMAIDLKPKP